MNDAYDILRSSKSNSEALERAYNSLPLRDANARLMNVIEILQLKYENARHNHIFNAFKDMPPRRLRNHTNDICQIAVDDYGLVIAQQALKDAELTGRTLNRAGPFLLAWSPKGKQDALVLVSDLSDITTYEQAHERFLAWSRDIESDPALWMSGWDPERLRTYIRSWVARTNGFRCRFSRSSHFLSAWL
jgi:hypothetical protein